MTLNSISLRVNLAVGVFVMGLLGIVLAVLVAESYRQFAINSQRSAFEQIIDLRAGDLLESLSKTSLSLGQSLRGDKNFRKMFIARDKALMNQFLESQFHQFFVTTGIIKLESLMTYDVDFNLLSMAISETASLDAGCSTLHKRARNRTGPARLKTIDEMCLVNGRPYFSIIIPIGGLQVTGYLEVVTDPVYSMQIIEKDLGMPLRVKYLDDTVTYQSKNWPSSDHGHESSGIKLVDTFSDHKIVQVGHFALTNLGEKAFQIIIAQDITEFEAQLSSTRNTYLAIVGGLGLLLALIMIYWLDKTALVPLHQLGAQLDSIRRDKTQLGTKVAIKGNAEVRKLAAGFNDMTDELKNLYDTLMANNEELSLEITNRENIENELKKHRDHLEDIVEQRTIDLAEARDSALEASRTKSLFLANMSHELRTPLNAIIGYSEMLIEEADDFGDEEIISDLKKVNNAGQHLLSLISSILDLTKIESGKMEIYEEWFNVRNLIGNVIDTFSPIVRENQNTLEIICPNDIGYIFCDSTKIRQAVFNLVGNACKFTHGGLVQLMVERVMQAEKECISFKVKDTGLGMTKVQQKKIFGVFTQADASTTRQFGGTGLGLVISRRLCEIMGGTLDMESVKGEGSVFTIILPAKGATWKRQDGIAPKPNENKGFGMEETG